MEIERAKAISTVAQTVIDSAKVEVQYANLTGQSNGAFFEAMKLENGKTLPPKP